MGTSIAVDTVASPVDTVTSVATVRGERTGLRAYWWCRRGTIGPGVGHRSHVRRRTVLTRFGCARAHPSCHTRSRTRRETPEL